jgi:CheY-like chemotaxis protein
VLIAQTGYGKPEDRRHALEAGFDLHLIKPVDWLELDRWIAITCSLSDPRPPP